jgi:hypothetical protein
MATDKTESVDAAFHAALDGGAARKARTLTREAKG